MFKNISNTLLAIQPAFTKEKTLFPFSCFVSQIFWLGRKNCVLNNKKWIIFPDSRYVNSNPGIYHTSVIDSENFKAKKVLVNYAVSYINNTKAYLLMILHHLHRF